MKNLILFSNLFILLVSCGNDKKESTNQEKNSKIQAEIVNKIIAIKEIAGKTKKEVGRILGESEKTEKVKPSNTPCKEKGCDKVFYKSGKYEIVYINDKADWITINNVSEYSLDENVISLLGIDKCKATFQNPLTVIRWENIEGIDEINFFNNGSDKIDYIYIKTHTK